MTNRIQLFLCLFLLFSCSAEKDVDSSRLKTETKKFSKETCINKSCATVNLTWPKLANGAVGERINQAIEEQLKDYFYSDSVSASLEELADYYLNSFREAKKEFPEMSGDWEIEVEATISFDSLNTLSVFFTEINNSGGAHPNSSNYFLNFDRATGEFLTVDRLILDQGKMIDLAEKAFRDFHLVEKGMSLEADGRFFLPETGFFLPNAMGFKNGKFQMIYIPYEIGPYAMGYTELVLSLEELKGIVRM